MPKHIRIKKVKISLLIVLILLTCFNVDIYSTENKNDIEVYKIPIKGEINKATANFVINNIREIESNHSDSYIIFDIDTYGGFIDSAIEIKDEILKTKSKTMSFVNNKAESAGVLISIASDELIMSTSATMGSAEVVPYSEKQLSFWRSVLRSVAEEKGREPIYFEAMADKDIEISGVVEKGKLLNVTSKEAEQLGISDYTADSTDEILNHYKIDDKNINYINPGFQVKLAGIISNPYVSSIILTLAFIGMVVEIFTPGFGIGGVISIISFGLYFGGNMLAGHSHWTPLILFITGLILIVVEIIIPGFGLPGISGILFVTFGVILAVGQIELAMISMSIAIITTALLTFLLIKLGLRSHIFDRVILQNSTKIKEESISLKANKNIKIGMIGTVDTPLRPSGYIFLENNERIDVISNRGYVEKGEKVRISKINGNKVIVDKVD